MLIFFSTLLELYLLSLLSLARFIVVRYPFEHRFKSSSFVLRYIFYGSLFSVVISVSFVLRFASNQTSPSCMCSPFIDPLDSLPEIKIITLLVTLVQVVAFTFISAFYLCLIKTLKERDQQSPVMSKTVNRLQLILSTASSLIGWLPSSIIFLSCLFLPTYPTALSMWTTIILVPTTSLANPLIFLIFDVKSKLRSSQRSGEST